MPENPPPTAQPPQSPPRGHRRLWLFLVIALLLVAQFWFMRAAAPPMGYSQLETELERDNVASVIVVPESRALRGSLRKGITADGKVMRTFAVTLPFTDAAPLVARLRAKGVRIEGGESGSLWATFLVSVLPWLLIVGFWLVAFRQLRLGGTQALAFGRARTGSVTPETPKITFADVADVAEAKAELQEIVAFLKNPEHFQRLGGHLPKGVLLVGAPGTGKTLLARATAGEAGRPFLTISGSDFVELFVGVGAARVRDLFVQGKAHAPCIIFIDELDAVGRTRGIAAVGGAHEEREQTLNQLLVEMDGFNPSEGIILLAATNRPDVLDPALLRAGRFDRRVVVPAPDAKGRLAILKVHTRKVPLSPDVDLQTIARGTPGFAGADLENLINEGALLAARNDHDLVSMADLEHSKDKVIMGAERRGMMLNADELKLTAVHEAGHALVSKHLKTSDPLHKVTIVPRGRALGLTQQLPERDRYSHSASYLLDRIAIMMGGRIAEDIVLGEITTGAANDIEQATEMARQMVCEWGMSRLGPLAFGKKTGEPFLGRDYGHTQNFSESTAVQVDQEIRRLVDENYNRARQILTDHRDQLDMLSTALLEFETLDGEEVDWIIESKDIKELRSGREAKVRHRVAQDQANSANKKPTPPPVIDSLPGLPEPLTH